MLSSKPLQSFFTIHMPTIPGYVSVITTVRYSSTIGRDSNSFVVVNEIAKVRARRIEFVH